MSLPFYPQNISASGTSYIDFVRFKVDDTVSTAYEVSDEIITALYNQTSSTEAQIVRNYRTAYAVAKYLEVKYTKQASFSSGGTSVQLKDRAAAWSTLVDVLGQELLQVLGSSPVIYPSRPSNFWEGW